MAIDKWGPVVSTRGLKQLYAPQQIKPFTATEAGIDNLALSSVDVFLLPSGGGKYQEYKVEFEGYFQVARAAPTTHDWATAEVYVNLTDLVLNAKASVKGFGSMKVRRNPDMVSAGQVLAAGAAAAPAKCLIATSVIFDVPERKMSLFNKVPILLMNGGIKSVPPVEDPNGKAYNYLVPLYDMKQPDGRPIGYLESLHYTVGNYITKEQADALRRH
jgi:Family of unknown function (DUF6073)